LAPEIAYNSWSEVPDRPPAGAKMLVEIFAGEAGTTSALRKLGVPCLPPVKKLTADLGLRGQKLSDEKQNQETRSSQ
jgi:hypothetical protein